MKSLAKGRLISLLLTIWLAGCAGGGSGSPALPSSGHEDSGVVSRPASPGISTHYLWGYYLITIDEDGLSGEVVPIRVTAGHWNVLQFLEHTPCDDCFKLQSVALNPDGTTNAYVSIRHPFANPNITGFDVRGIAMFEGSYEFPDSGLVMSDRGLNEGVLVNADGYTTLYNPGTFGNGIEGYIEGKLATESAPTATLNGFRRYVTDDPANTRNAFFAGDEIVVNNKIAMPDPLKPWVFGYAVDACWVPATNIPVDDPISDFAISANCPEAWKIEVQDLGPGITLEGGSTMLQIDVYDWQGKDQVHPVLAECPDLVDGGLQASWVSDGDGYTRYAVEIDNLKLPPTGRYACLISVEAQENDPVGKPWLDLSAYQVFYVTVGWHPGYPIDVTPPSLSLWSYEACTDGNYAYVASGANGLQIFDISDPEDPVWISQVATPNDAQKVAASGGYAYVTYSKYATDISGLQIVDIDPPQSAHVVKTLPSISGVVAVSGDYAYVAGGSLYIIDINPPESAYVVKTLSAQPEYSYFGGGIAVSGGYAYVGTEADYEDERLSIIDVDPPESAYVVKTVVTSYFDLLKGVAVSGGYAYVADGSFGLRIIDIHPPDTASIVNTIVTGHARGVTVSGDYAYVAASSACLHIIDVQTPESAYIVESLGSLPGTAWGVAVSSGYAYVSGLQSGLHVVDIDPPEEARYVKTIGFSRCPDGIAVSGDYAFITDDWSNLAIVNINPPESAHLYKTVSIPATLGRLVVTGGYAYILSSAGLLIIDIDPIESGHFVKLVETTGQFIAVSGGYAYIADWNWFEESALQIVDIDPPESAYVVNSLATPVEARGGVTASGGYAYLVGVDWETGTESLAIIDVDPPQSAHVVKSVGGLQGIGAFAVSDGYAFVTGWGLQVIDIDPLESAYYVRAIYAPTGGIGQPVPSGDYMICTSSGDVQLQVVDVDPASSGFVVASVAEPEIPGPQNPALLAVSGNYAYITYSDATGEFGGLRIIRLW